MDFREGILNISWDSAVYNNGGLIKKERYTKTHKVHIAKFLQYPTAAGLRANDKEQSTKNQEIRQQLWFKSLKSKFSRLRLARDTSSSCFFRNGGWRPSWQKRILRNARSSSRIKLYRKLMSWFFKQERNGCYNFAF